MNLHNYLVERKHFTGKGRGTVAQCGLEKVLIVTECGQENNRKIGMLPLHLRNRLNAVSVRQHNALQNEIVSVVLQARLCFLQLRCGFDAMVPAR
jgi:hypothetical protein